MYYYLNDNSIKSNYLYNSNYLKIYSKESFHTSKNNYFKIKRYIKIIIFFNKVLFICLSYSFSNLLNKVKKCYYESKNEAKNLEKYFYLCNKGLLINKIKFKKIENPKISIISSIYNREKFILRFLRSVQNQFFDDIEIILVDDSSKDNSVKLIEKFKKDDERIILIKHKKNKGTLISRNDGILFSKGEYLIIPDIDDILSENILYNCYILANLNKYEMIRFNIYIGNKTIFFEDIVNEIENVVIFHPIITTYLFYGLGYIKQIDFNLSNKFIKRDAYVRALNSMEEFYLKQYMVNLEDGIMNYILYRIVKSFYFLKKIGYFYLQNNQSITVKTTENYDHKARFIFIHWKFVFENSKNNKYEKDMVNSIINRLYFLLKDDFYLITKDFQFYYDNINIFLNCKFINKDNKKLLKNFKNFLYKKIVEK